MVTAVTQFERDEAFTMSNLGMSNREIGHKLKRSHTTIGGILRQGERVSPEGPFVEVPAASESFQERLADFQKWIGDTTSLKLPKARTPKAEKKNLILNDLHSPFHDQPRLGKAIHDNKDADEVWLLGDINDLFSFSRYLKFTAPFTPIEEFQAGQAFIKTVAETFPRVKVMSGNHDDRFIKWLVRDKQIPPNILDFFVMQDANFLSPLAKMCAPFSNVEVVAPLKLDFARFPFIHQEGDCILSHAERFSKIPNKVVSDVIHWLKSFCEPAGLVNPFKLVVQAHTHQAGKTWCDYGVVGIEAGCLALTPDYAGDARLGGSQRQSVSGYTVIYQTNGVTDLNKSNFIQIA